MTIEDIRALKFALEAELMKVIAKFEVETRVNVESISVDRFRQLSGESSVATIAVTLESL